jgi:hypothetical protein
MLVSIPGFRRFRVRREAANFCLPGEGTVNALGVSLAAVAIILCGAVGGIALRRALPERHLADDTKDVVRLGTGLVGTIAALVLGLLIASAKGTYDNQAANIQHIAADAILLDQILAFYGPETRPVREELRGAIEPLVELIWRQNRSNAARWSGFEQIQSGQDAYVKVAQLAPQNDFQRILKDRAVQTIVDLTQARLSSFEQAGNTIPLPFVAVLIFWLAIIFASFGMFSRHNPTSIAALIVFAVSASGALFLVLELSEPFTGLLQISSEPLRHALPPL